MSQQKQTPPNINAGKPFGDPDTSRTQYRNQQQNLDDSNETAETKIHVDVEEEVQEDQTQHGATGGQKPQPKQEETPQDENSRTDRNTGTRQKQNVNFRQSSLNPETNTQDELERLEILKQRAVREGEDYVRNLLRGGTSTYRPSTQSQMFRSEAGQSLLGQEWLRDVNNRAQGNNPSTTRQRSSSEHQMFTRERSPTRRPNMATTNRRQGYTSSPNDSHEGSIGGSANSEHERTRQESLSSLIDRFNTVGISNPTEPAPTVPKVSSTPQYVPAELQALQMHQKAIDDTLERANMMQKMMQLMLHARPNTGEDVSNQFDHMAREMVEDIQASKQKAQQSAQGMKKASKIVDYYRTPILKPENLTAVESARTRVNLKELLMVTGYFDPSDKESDFKHVWHKLLDYGKSENYGETHYMQALGAVLKKEAYETFCDFKQTERSLTEILEHFAIVYTKKRTIGDAKMAVDNFTRKKGESILACMNRTLLVVDRLKIHYDQAAWPQMQQQMRRHILMQVIKEETKRHIQMEEDYITETTGLPYDFDNLIRKADNYERYNNAVPETDIQTVFKVASGGLIQKKSKSPEQQLQHLKKEQMLETRLSTLQARLENIEANAMEPRTFKFEGRKDQARESRSRERDARQRQSRDSSLNKGRNFEEKRNLLEDDDVQMKEAKPMKPEIAKPKFVPPNPYQDQQKQAQTNFQKTNFQSNRGRPQTSFQDQRFRQASRSPGGTPFRQNFEGRPFGQNSEGRNFRQNSGGNQFRSQSRSPSRPVTPFDRSRSQSANSQNNSRSSSWNRSSNKENTTITTSGKVYITINGQEYVAKPNFQKGN